LAFCQFVGKFFSKKKYKKTQNTLNIENIRGDKYQFLVDKREGKRGGMCLAAGNIF